MELDEELDEDDEETEDELDEEETLIRNLQKRLTKKYLTSCKRCRRLKRKITADLSPVAHVISLT